MHTQIQIQILPPIRGNGQWACGGVALHNFCFALEALKSQHRTTQPPTLTPIPPTHSSAFSAVSAVVTKQVGGGGEAWGKWRWLLFNCPTNHPLPPPNFTPISEKKPHLVFGDLKISKRNFSYTRYTIFLEFPKCIPFFLTFICYFFYKIFHIIIKIIFSKKFN